MKRKWLGIAIVVCLTLGLIVSGCAAPAVTPTPTEAEVPLGEPIRIGLITALTGECSLWGLPLYRGAKIYVDEVNAAGGIIAGGERHLIEFKGYDNICWIATEELKVAKKAILEDNMKYLLTSYGKGATEARAPFGEEHKVLQVGYGATYLRPQWTYTMACNTGIPLCFAAGIEWVVEQNPEIKRAAIMCTDDYPTIRVWYEAGARAAGLDVVFNELYPPDTTDFRPLMTKVLATKPDIILEHCTPQYGAWLGTALSLGYTGCFMKDDLDEHLILAAVPGEYVTHRLYSPGMANFESTFWPEERFHHAYETFCSIYGEDEWSSLGSAGYDQLTFICEVGIPAADSIDPTDVRDAIYAMSEIDHPVYGESEWGGMEISGCNQHLWTPISIQGFKDGKLATLAKYSFADWFRRHEDVVMSVLEKWQSEYGMLYRPE